VVRKFFLAKKRAIGKDQIRGGKKRINSGKEEKFQPGREKGPWKTVKGKSRQWVRWG